MITNFKKEKIPFTQVANEVLNDKKLSLKAKGLYAYLFSKPDGWDFSSIRIKEDHIDGRKSVLSGLKELEKFGVLDRKKHADGRLEYVLKHSTQNPLKATRVSEPESPNGTQPKRHSAETDTVSNKDNTSNKDKKSNKEAHAEKVEEVKVMTPREKAKHFFDGITEVVKTQNLIKDLKAKGEAEDIPKLEELIQTHWVSDFMRQLHSKHTNIGKGVLWNEIRDFAMYWTESTGDGRKKKWEIQATFEHDRRLITWLNKPFRGFKENHYQENKNTKPRGKTINV